MPSIPSSSSRAASTILNTNAQKPARNLPIQNDLNNAKKPTVTVNTLPINKPAGALNTLAPNDSIKGHGAINPWDN